MAGGKKTDKKKVKTTDYSRRDFLIGGGAALAVCTPVATAFPSTSPAPAKTDYAASKGYLVYDSKKCAGCTTCMLSCSLTHYGVQNLSLSRIQIIQDSFGKFPDDVKMAPCRQCVTPVCVENCPVGAAYVDTANGNVRRIDSKKCIGCKTCIKMCPQQPHRTVWNHVEKKSSKCDLCLDTPHWKEKGGPGGKQACVESCPMKAIKFVVETPNQEETEGYDVNLRNEHWLNLGLVENSIIVPPAVALHAKQKPMTFEPKPKPKAQE
jgi:protein NrfC